MYKVSVAIIAKIYQTTCIPVAYCKPHTKEIFRFSKLLYLEKELHMAVTLFLEVISWKILRFVFYFEDIQDNNIDSFCIAIITLPSSLSVSHWRKNQEEKTEKKRGEGYLLFIMFFLTSVMSCYVPWLKFYASIEVSVCALVPAVIVIIVVTVQRLQLAKLGDDGVPCLPPRLVTLRKSVRVAEQPVISRCKQFRLSSRDNFPSRDNAHPRGARSLRGHIHRALVIERRGLQFYCYNAGPVYRI